MQPTKFTSKLGFILASVGSAVGMGNIWMFPYRVGKYGGAAFLIPYFLFVALFGAVGLSAEFGIGRLTGTGPIGSYGHILKSRNPKLEKLGKGLGTLPLLGSLGIAIGYAVIVGWVLRYLGGSITGSLMKTVPEDYFASITGALGNWPWHAILVAVTALVLLSGVLKGIEKMNKIMMPAFFLLFLVLAIRVAFLDGASAGYAYLLVPKWEFLAKPETWIMAMGQAFFSLSITGSGMIIYGSYLNKNTDIVHASAMTAILDTCAALLSSFVIIPAVFAFGLDPTAGPPLMFQTMPRIFAQMPMGQVFSVVFFVSVLFAGITSLINMLEVCTEAASTNLKWSRKLSILVVAALTLGVGLLIEEEAKLGAWMDAITIYVSPIGAVLGAFLIYWVLKRDQLAGELNLARPKPLSAAFFLTGKYVYVLLAAAVLVLNIALGGIG